MAALLVVLVAALLPTAAAAASAGATAPDGLALLRATLSQEEQLASFSALIVNALGADDTQVVQCRYWRRRAPDGSAQVRVALLPSAAAAPAATTATAGDDAVPAPPKLFIFSGGRCCFTWKSRSILVDPALVPTYGIADFISLPAPGQVITVAPAVVLGQPCTHLTQAIAADAASGAGAFVMDYDIDQASGLIVQVVRHDAGAVSYRVQRRELAFGPAATSDALFAPPAELRQGVITSMAALSDALVHGIP